MNHVEYPSAVHRVLCAKSKVKLLISAFLYFCALDFHVDSARTPGVGHTESLQARPSHHKIASISHIELPQGPIATSQAVSILKMRIQPCQDLRHRLCFTHPHLVDLLCDPEALGWKLSALQQLSWHLHLRPVWCCPIMHCSKHENDFHPFYIIMPHTLLPQPQPLRTTRAIITTTIPHRRRNRTRLLARPRHRARRW